MAKVAADGSINVTVVDGTSRVPRLAADGSINVVLADSTVGSNHPSGAMIVTVGTGTDPLPRTAPDGSVYVVEDPYTPTGPLRVTAVSGDLTP